MLHKGKRSQSDKLFEKAASMGHTTANGICLYHGIGQKKAFGKAKRYIFEAASSGCSTAIYLSGMLVKQCILTIYRTFLYVWTYSIEGCE